MKLDYSALGLKVGLEMHQQLDTKHKLFCACPTRLRKESPSVNFRRYLRPTQSELGEVDPAALFEFKRGRVYVYESYDDSVCLVEHDEEPPHDLNPEAIDIALMVALMLHARPVDEIHVMRKIVIDGSNTTGFQRTAIIALGGYVDDIEGKVPIQTICLEEDAARKMGEKEKEVYYRLDRLGIPLIEIATAPVLKNPEQVERVAYKIGQILRMTGKVKRGIGTIRQDLNISIKGGAKIEIKGVQELGLLAKIVEYEVLRQVNLLKIRDELLKRGVREDDIVDEFVDITDVFQNTKCRIIANAIKRGHVVYALKLPKFSGLLGFELQPGRRFGTELADYARFWGGVKGLFHTDELPGYGISSDEVSKLRTRVHANLSDAVVIIADEESKVIEALKAVARRAKMALKGVPEETRGYNPDGTTHYSRPRPGAARMYPETDVRPIFITIERLEKIRKMLPEPPEKKFEKFVKVYGLSRELAKQMLASYRLDLFEKLVSRHKSVSPTLIATTLEQTIKSLARDGVPVDNIMDEHLEELFECLEKGLIAKEAIPKILEYVARNPECTVLKAIEKLGIKAITREELESLVKEIVDANIALINKLGERAWKPIMGMVMKRVRGRIDGRIVAETVRRIVSEKIKSSTSS
ncbi:MAG: Glu-tRNA(Gln) amidotransferase GatDE subunit E [Thermoprotei archaeon]|nr:MAG: Glu-tRNA(Gln) amidotransferase GatDE subunit E [Thermoprotei archaeon]RLF23373.1 MAG: Glu-tRNA(Gln) amidotransferase GatDE subunit E [Thermoprotei archaeon]